ncbi:MAG TPA: amidohydrolase [Bacteroidota bacterium]|nr:amidohydrolase [Bacteroidota bacterium]
MKIFTTILLAGFLWHSLSAQSSIQSLVDAELPKLLESYKHLHANPELSHFEQKTARYLADQLRGLGFEVTEGVGKYDHAGRKAYSVVAVMRNGQGPTILVRTDIDALPVEEKTELPYASKVKTKNELGEEVGVMHACGHDLHMTSFLGTAKLVSKLKDQWRGTVVFVGQPAEERGTGAKAMLADGLYTRFPKPDYAIALHTDATLPVGKIGYCEGYALANVNSVDITVRGVGGHGAYPHTTKDPIVIASQIVLALQTIVSREISPLDPAVVTVGAIQGGTKHNIIPDEVHLQLTLRSYKEEVRLKLIAAIKRIAKGIAEAAGVPENRLPVVTVNEEEFTPATYNTPELTRRLASALEAQLGKNAVVKRDPVMGGEDFGRFALEGNQIPLCMFWLGAVAPEAVEKAQKGLIQLPSLHSSEFAPVPDEAIKTGVKTLTISVLELLNR